MLQGSILRKYSLEVSGKIGEFDHAWWIATLSISYGAVAGVGNGRRLPDIH